MAGAKAAVVATIATAIPTISTFPSIQFSLLHSSIIFNKDLSISLHFKETLLNILRKRFLEYS
jgi:hypothetical protein